MSSGATDASIICDHATTSGAYTLANGTWAATVKCADGKDASIQGHWLNVYEKIVVLIHVQNTQMP